MRKCSWAPVRSAFVSSVAAALFALVVPVTVTLVSPQVAGAATALQFTTTTLPGGTVGQPYSVQFGATGGTAPYMFIGGDHNDPMPPGLSMSSSGLLSGTPGPGPLNQPTRYLVGISVVDSTNASSHVILPVTITPPGYQPPPPLQITTSSIPDATFNSAYSFQMQATGGTPPYSWTATGLPQGFTMSQTGVISGQYILPEQATITVNVTDSGPTFGFPYEPVYSSSQQSTQETFTFTVTSGYPQLDPGLFKLSALLAGVPALEAEVANALAVVEGDIAQFECEYLGIGGIGCRLL